MSSSPPIKVRVNTFLNKTSVDIVSKIIIFTELALGLDRVSILGKQKLIYVLFTTVYSALFKCSIIPLFYWFNEIILMQFVVGIKLAQYFFLCIFSQLARKRLLCFYEELDKFDTEVSCRPKTTWSSVRILVQLCLVIIYITAVLYFHPLKASMIIFPIHVINAIENIYYGHLLNLLIPRIRLINYYLESSLSNDKILKSSDENEFVFYGSRTMDVCGGRMGRFMDLYHALVSAHSLLIHAIKWQLLVIITTSFVYMLFMLYNIAISLLYDVIDFNYRHALAYYLGIVVAEMISLFVPCICCDQIRAEVRRLRELLASILFENRLQKPCRSVCRALLALTEARDLSFSLLRVVDISISLPFTFMGVLVTYLIIMLQFQKVNGD